MNTPLSEKPQPILEPVWSDRMTVREFKRQQSRVRYQQRLARAPGYRLGLLLLLINALGWLVFVLQGHS